MSQQRIKRVSDPTIEEQKENKSTGSLTKDNQSEEEKETSRTNRVVTRKCDSTTD